MKVVAPLIACALTLPAFAGPLDPPAGPITSTYKTITEVEPRIAINATNTPGDADSLFKITQPGSYYLTGNITGIANKHGIEIAASGVTLDLNGFDLVGVAGMGVFDGVGATVASLANITVVNGSVRNWGDEGVDLGTVGATNCRVEGVLVSGNAGRGIDASIGSTVSNCTAYGNTGIGINTNVGCTVSNCSAYQNTSHGISAGSGSTVSHCTAAFNAGSGISVGAGGTTVSNCSAYQNTSHGISAGSGCTVSNCTANSNTGNGISASVGCTVEGCSVRSNVIDGIQCTSQCVILGNTCSVNGSGAGGGAGIHTTGTDNRIEGNTCTSAARGIDVDNAGNIIIRNTCSGNTTNWDIAANNVYGPILDRTAPASAPILGNSAPSSLGTTDPNANFSY